LFSREAIMKKTLEKKFKECKELDSEYRDGVNRDFEKMLEMEFEDFKREAVEYLKTLWWRTREGSGRDGKLDGIGTLVSMLVHKLAGGQVSQKEMVTILEGLGYEWTEKYEQALRKVVEQQAAH
jgi:hypothetical protein